MLTDAQIRSLPEIVLGTPERCCVCRKQYGTAERAHVRNVQMGGKRKEQGPRLWLCYECHHEKLHASPASYRLDIDEQGRVWWTEPQIVRVVAEVPGSVVESRPDVFVV